ncbi:Pyruvate carboxylase/oxaloacetate decarboxylase gamma subunit [Sulfurimonas denitrificans DSM 1251]|jgi:oxaloacetate decarboxylase gamma subunit|uniref:Probable oxaloacetate decarboxylase gamma chain n=1 Tax=Sulfurimonas denitrificans (strain ATCC 33889 / DSM 1251) TaxID=326298 RepID=Q30R43_SULDN|nr:OadG family transporter subunit [Sulfurimonas denitrificans]ABB44538.1 Pyruvate carboxylase/oxaloacetate decarboxylase gamma subunit [Sulfurimonas denitrificans DSM 1251]MDD3441721.1 OadG family transporter subunit [Sulfurimonas denitrificans]
METNLVLEGVKFMGLGMGAVFLFLAVMIFFIGVMSKTINKFFPEVRPIEGSSSKNTQNNNQQQKVVAAITAAIKHHRES